MGEFSLGGVLFFVHYDGKCWYLYFLRTAIKEPVTDKIDRFEL